MARKSTEIRESDKPYEPITPQQQQFIEALLTGKSITEAAKVADVSRRAATYWMNSSSHPVRVEYDKQRTNALAGVSARVASLHELAFSVLETLLMQTEYPEVRFKVAKLLYETQLEPYCRPKPPLSSVDLVADVVDEIRKENHKIGESRVRLFDDHGREWLFALADL
jgi:hypothetical protein